MNKNISKELFKYFIENAKYIKRRMLVLRPFLLKYGEIDRRLHLMLYLPTLNKEDEYP